MRYEIDACREDALRQIVVGTITADGQQVIVDEYLVRAGGDEEIPPARETMLPLMNGAEEEQAGLATWDH